jgi:hypothetical protein
MKETLKGKKETNRNSGLVNFFNKPVFLHTGEKYVPHNSHKAKDTLERAQLSGDSIIHLFPNIHVRSLYVPTNAPSLL